MNAQLNTRIQIKVDTENAWNLVRTTFVPLSGEMCIYRMNDDSIRIKVGDGITTVGSLEFIDEQLQVEVTNLSETVYKAILYESDEAITDCNEWLTNGYAKTSTATSNLPPQCTGNDRWGVIFFIAENAEMGTGTQMYYPIDGDNKEFNPIYHQAVLTEKGDTPGMVIEVMQKGYLLKDKVIRPAMVKVSE